MPMFATRMFKISSYEIASWNPKPTQYSVLLKYYVVTQTYFPGLCTNYRAKTGNNVSEFTHSNCIMPSYYSSPKYKSLFHKYLIIMSNKLSPLSNSTSALLEF